MMRAEDSLVVLEELLAAIEDTIHLIRVDEGIGTITVEDDGWEAGPSLCRLLLQLLATSWIVDHGDLSRIVDVELAIIDEALHLEPDVLGVAEVLLEVVVGLLQIPDLGEPPGQLGLGVAIGPLRLLDLFLGPPALGGDLHEVAGVALGDYMNEEDQGLEKIDDGRCELCSKVMVLTADGGALGEDGGDLRVHVDHHVLVGLDLVVALPHLGLDPLGEGLADDGVDEVRDVLPRQLLHLLLDGEVPSQLRIRAGKCLDVLDGEAFELRHVDVLRLVAADALLGSGLDVPKMPDGDVFEWRQVGIDLGGQEAVYLTLRLELGGEFCCGDLGRLAEDLCLPPAAWDLVVVGVHGVC